MFLQILVLISSLLSISWGAVALTSLLIDTEYKICDYTFDMLWNVLAISSRVITLALFASQYKYCFAAVVTVICILWAAAIIYMERDEISHAHECIPGLVQGIGYTFNIFQVSLHDKESVIVGFKWYMLYWCVTMVQNIVLISVWFSAVSDADPWYRIPALVYVIVAYVLSLLVKTFHTKIRDRSEFV